MGLILEGCMPAWMGWKRGAREITGCINNERIMGFKKGGTFF
jgi:hypothetical protein